MPHIAIITVVYKNYTVLEDFLKSLEQQKEQNFHLVIADASPLRKKISTTVPLTIIPVKNKGYAHGVNAGIQKAQELGLQKYCVINDDVSFQSEFTRNLSSAFQNNPNTVFGGKIYYAKGFEYHKEQYSNKDQGAVIWYAGGTVDWNHAIPKHVGVDEVDTGNYNEKTPTGFITGCLVCFDQTVVEKIGFWDEHYFLYYEDADFCERAKRASIPLWYIPNLTIWHKNAQSTDGSGSPLHQKFQKKARLRFAMKYVSLRTKLHILKNYFI